MTADTVTVRVRTYTVRLVRLVGRNLQFIEGDEGWEVIWDAFRQKYRNDLLHIRASTHEVEDRTVVFDRKDPIGATVTSTETARFKGTFAKERGGQQIPGVFTSTETVTLTPAKDAP